MTGPEHYRTAEQHLSIATELHDDGRYELAAARAGFAQVHATLALAAAAAIEPAHLARGRKAREDWETAAMPSIEWTCDGCGSAMITAPGGEIPSPAVCDGCWRGGIAEREAKRAAATAS